MSTLSVADSKTRTAAKAANPVTIVSGLPRSGTSLMMKMLGTAKVELVTDNIREADENNPNGYFEFERVKKLKEGDFRWLRQSRGKAVKVISALLEHLPSPYFYRVIFMQRRMEEILASQRSMLKRRARSNDMVDDEQMARLFDVHLAEVKNWLSKQANFEVLYLNYNHLLQSPLDNLNKVNQFLGGQLDVSCMAQMIDNSLYRQRYQD
jgi:hypothetical protein